MSPGQYHLFLLFLAAVLLWQLLSGRALGVWWRPNITRKNDPLVYWLVLAVQGAILIAILINGTSTWNFR
jgi:hypothetical protein